MGSYIDSTELKLTKQDYFLISFVLHKIRPFIDLFDK